MSSIPYTILRSSRKTISIVIKPSGEVEVRCPRRCSKRDVDAFVVSKEDWIRKHLEAIAQSPQQPVLSRQELNPLRTKQRQCCRKRCSGSQQVWA